MGLDGIDGLCEDSKARQIQKFIDVSHFFPKPPPKTANATESSLGDGFTAAPPHTVHSTRSTPARHGPHP